MLELLYYYLEFGGNTFFGIFWLSSFYFLFRYAFSAFGFIFFKRDLAKDIKFFKSITIFYLIIFGFFVLLGVIIGISTNFIPISRIVFFDNYFMQIDKNVFGAYLPFWLQDIRNPLKPIFDSMSFIIIDVYFRIALLMGILFLTELVLNARNFYKLVLTFSIALIIGTPLWIAFPAIPPYNVYYNNILNIQGSEGVKAEMSNYKPNPYLASFLESMKKLDEKYPKMLPITSMPSMHIAWALMIVYFGIMIWRPLAVVLIPYFIINTIATLYILQHYTIDLLAGFIVGIISIWLAHIIAERKVPKLILGLTENIQEDINNIKLFFKSLYLKK